MRKSLIIIILMLVACNISAQAKNDHLKQQKKMKNATILHNANEFVLEGDYESFLAYCTPGTKWVFVGERTLNGKEEVRAYMKEFYYEPPVFSVEKTIEDGDFVMVTGEIRLKNKDGKYEHFDYCDLWRFEDGKIAELKAFVIEKK
ncbi:nuclear transport factor 2 family protein [Sphingobacterium sp. BIGb0116]|uniref:nuclear transport factor 2 family protein n=1 Tax=Sphingobacterium sp. BIGb0116 TaxID=2940619 RepID=UPI002168755E|nr:nuclear transport factor 2 family protein [Sphingobacterium sp. BIGb0116]MCS4168503.1 ketosteroid isomerase-like protein [Sphingobacterium sp. BIGb0116]